MGVTPEPCVLLRWGAAARTPVNLIDRGST